MSGDRGILAAVVALTVLASVAFAGVAAGQNQVTLTVTVVDGDGDPVSDVDLTASWNGGETAETTRSNGQALVDVPEGSDVEITIDHPNYVRNQPYEVSDASGGDVEVPIVRAGTATVEVVDSEGPVADAIVRLRQDGQLVVNERTGSDGTVETGQIERDTYQLTTLKAGYARNRTDLAVDGSVEQTMRISEQSVTITVTALDDHYDPPRAVRNATVSVADIGSVRTLSGGEATISVPVNDEYEVTVEKEGYEANTVTVDVSESQFDRNVTINRTPAVNVTAAQDRVVVGERVEVTVSDEYGEIVEGATISLDGSEVGTTDADGALDVSIDGAGEHTIHAAAESLTDTTTVEGIEPAAEDTVTTASPTNTSSEGGPGFGTTGPVVALVALLALVTAGRLVERRRR